METQQLERLKINSTNIKNSLFSFNKQMRKLRIDENKLIINKQKQDQLEEKEKNLEAPGKGLIENIKSKIIAGPMSIFDKIKEFFGIVLVGLVINNLPQIVSKVTEAGTTLINVTSSIINVITQTVNGINGFISIIQSLPEATKRKLIEGKDQLQNLILEMNKIIDPMNKEYTKLQKDLNSKQGGTSPSQGSSRPNNSKNNEPIKRAAGGTVSNISPKEGTGRGSPSDIMRGTPSTKVTSSPYARPGGSPSLRRARQSYNAFGDFYNLSTENREKYSLLGETNDSFYNVNESLTDFLQEFRKLKVSSTTPTPPTPANQNNPPVVNGQTYTAPTVSGSGVPSQTEAYRGRGVNPPSGVNPHGYPARDYPVSSGLPISVFIPGEVVFAGMAGNYGNLVEIKHVTGQVTRYAHLRQIKVKVGDKIDDGTSKLIGYSGGGANDPGRGNSTGSHLHFEMLDPTGKTSMDYNTGDSFFRFKDGVQIKTKKAPQQTSSLLDPLNSSVASNIKPNLKTNPDLTTMDEEDDVQIVMINTVQQVIQNKTRTVMVNSGRKDPFPSSSPDLLPLPGIWNA
jgi:murein DD-endopeptidase MepM/ murein hydrolase activator NlpD